LDRKPGHKKLSPRDRRWIKRREAWGLALLALRRLRSRDSEELRQQVIETAINHGFFSVWMTVFQSDSDMRRRLIAAFQGTAMCCFDTNIEAKPRLGGSL